MTDPIPRLLRDFIPSRNVNSVIPTLIVFTYNLRDKHDINISIQELKSRIASDTEYAAAYEEYSILLEDNIIHLINMKKINQAIGLAYLERYFGWNSQAGDTLDGLSEEQLDAQIKALNVSE